MATQDDPNKPSTEETAEATRRPGRPSRHYSDQEKVQRSRQSARECRNRKNVRYQYLKQLVNLKERSVFKLRDEINKYKKWCKELDNGTVPEELVKEFELSHQLRGTKVVKETPNVFERGQIGRNQIQHETFKTFELSQQMRGKRKQDIGIEPVQFSAALDTTQSKASQTRIRSSSVDRGSKLYQLLTLKSSKGPTLSEGNSYTDKTFPTQAESCSQVQIKQSSEPIPEVISKSPTEYCKRTLPKTQSESLSDILTGNFNSTILQPSFDISTVIPDIAKENRESPVSVGSSSSSSHDTTQETSSDNELINWILKNDSKLSSDRTLFQSARQLEVISIESIAKKSQQRKSVLTGPNSLSTELFQKPIVTLEYVQDDPSHDSYVRIQTSASSSPHTLYQSLETQRNRDLNLVPQQFTPLLQESDFRISEDTEQMVETSLPLQRSFSESYHYGSHQEFIPYQFTPDIRSHPLERSVSYSYSSPPIINPLIRRHSSPHIHCSSSMGQNRIAQSSVDLHISSQLANPVDTISNLPQIPHSESDDVLTKPIREDIGNSSSSENPISAELPVKQSELVGDPTQSHDSEVSTNVNNKFPFLSFLLKDNDS